MRVVLRIYRDISKIDTERNSKEVRRKSARSERASLFRVRTARLVGGNHTVACASPNNTYFVVRCKRFRRRQREKGQSKEKGSLVSMSPRGGKPVWEWRRLAGSWRMCYWQLHLRKMQRVPRTSNFRGTKSHYSTLQNRSWSLTNQRR